MAHWIVARTKSRRERWAAENVQRQGYKFYLPQYEITSPIRGNLKKVRTEPLFPSYLFIEIDGPWRVLLCTFGIAGIVLRGDQPAVMPQSEITRLQIASDEAGFVQIPNTYKEGQAVRARSGPFVGHIGLYAGQPVPGRHAVLMDLLGGKIKTLFDSEMLEVA